MTGSVPIDSATFKLNDFLTTMSRDSGSSVSGRSLAVARGHWLSLPPRRRRPRK